jgi:8-oxo-dGTP diphosphatase
LEKKDEKLTMYSYPYPRAALTVDAIVVAKKTLQILLIKRGIEPFLGMWALPGGFVDIDETLEEACRRELSEETGLIAGNLTQFKAFDAVGRDPRGRTISVVFYTFIDNPENVEGMDDAASAQWFPLNRLPGLAFDHEEVISEFKTFKGL